MMKKIVKQFKKQRGFTLLEVLVALTILSIALAAILKASHSQVLATERLEQANLERWVGMNVIAQMQAGILKNLVEEQAGESIMLGKTWYWKAVPKLSGAAGILQVRISVGLDKHQLKHITVLGFVRHE